MSDDLEARALLEPQEKTTAEIRTRLATPEPRQHQLLPDISAPVGPTARQPPASVASTARQPSPPVGPAIQQPLTSVVPAAQQPSAP